MLRMEIIFSGILLLLNGMHTEETLSTTSTHIWTRMGLYGCIWHDVNAFLKDLAYTFILSFLMDSKWEEIQNFKHLLSEEMI